MQKIWRYKWWLLALLILLVLFGSSSMTYQEQTSVPFLERVLANEPFKATVAKIQINYGAGEIIGMPTDTYFQVIEFIMRKIAHFSSYFLLGWFLTSGLRTNIKPAWFRVWMVPMMAGGFAALDELHQMFTGGRSPMVQDVVLDMIGATVATLVVLLVEKLWARHLDRRERFALIKH
jgi:VanZ family protein